ncbi:MAG: Ca2+-dependent phosphoinositide-specific phospholipase C [Myxococcales bacterium]
MQYRARALTRAVSFLGLLLALTGCTRVPELSGMGTLLSARDAAHGPLASTTAEALTLDQLQLKGSHNSYHQAPRMALAKGWRYSHLPLRKQLETQGVRQIELDVRYSGGQVVVGHLPIVDGRSSCRTLAACLQQVKAWSDENPSHLPLFVFLEPKEHITPSNLDGRLEVLDQTIAKVFPRSSLLTPRDVAGEERTLKEAVQAHGWPSLESTRGKVVFVLFGRKNHTRAYGEGRPRLEGRLMFAAGRPQDPYAVFASCDDPVAEKAEIAAALDQGMLVRTRADSDLRRDRNRRDAALASGAHFIGSDFVDPKSNWLALGERAPARCNPLSGAACVSAALTETPEDVVALGANPALPAASASPAVGTSASGSLVEERALLPLPANASATGKAPIGVP